MPRYRFRSIQEDGRKEDGLLEAPSRSAALRTLRNRGQKVLHLSEEGSRKEGLELDQRPESTQVTSSSLKEKHCLRFIQMMRRLLEGGLSTGEAVASIKRTCGDPALAGFTQKVWQQLSDGSSFADTMRQSGSGLAPDHIELLRAGEATGKIAPVLEDLEKLITDRREVRETLIAKLSYPAFLSFVAFLVCGFMVLVLIPQVENILQSLRVEMSLPLRVLLFVSESVFWFVPLLIILVVGGGVGITLARKNPRGRLWLDRQTWNLPVVRSVSQPYLNYKICRTTGSLLANGINLTESLTLVSRTISNRYLGGRFETLRQEVNDGESVTSALSRQEMFDPLSLGVLGTHENIGRLESGFVDLSDQFRKQLDGNLSLLIKLVSGGALGLAFLLVSIIAVAIIIALFEVARGMG